MDSDEEEENNEINGANASPLMMPQMALQEEDEDGLNGTGGNPVDGGPYIFGGPGGPYN